jgi:hypothetical protein
VAKWIRDNSLTLALAVLFLMSLVGQAFTGLAAENDERMLDALPPVALPDYLGGGEFLSALFENWESEFLQMWAYVMLTAYLFQRGSPESRDPDGEETRPGEGKKRKRSAGRTLYEHSLGLAMLLLFIASFALHWVNSFRKEVEEAAREGHPAPELPGYLGDPQLWFESFQNWQSEFMSTAVLVVLGIFLRERFSPESKGVGEPNSKTGTA